MLIGEYTHTLDPKKRLSLPAKIRKELGKKVVITRGLDGCLFVFPLKTWSEVSSKLAELALGGQADKRGFSRFMLSGAAETDIDNLGRILVPDYLKDFAALQDQVVLTGVYNRIEIWNTQRWSEYKQRIEKQADELAEKLGQIGAI